MRKITFNFAKQQKRIQQSTTHYLRKGYSVKKVRKMIEQNYGISITDVSLVYDKKKGIFRKKKNVSAKALTTQKTKYKNAMMKNIHKKMQVDKVKEITTTAFFKKYFSTDVSMQDFKDLLQNAGYYKSWENMSTAEYYDELEQFSNYAEQFYKKHEYNTQLDIYDLSEDELLIYSLGAKLLKKSPLA